MKPVGSIVIGQNAELFSLKVDAAYKLSLYCKNLTQYAIFWKLELRILLLQMAAVAELRT